MTLVDIPEPRPGPEEVLVRVAACGICGSDLSCYKTGVFAPNVLGHELSGTVEGTGARVVVDPKIPCGACDDCARGASHRCVQALTHGIGQTRQGAFAPLIAVPAGSLHPVPDGLDLVTASLAEPMAVVLHGLSLLAFEPDLALVLGLGPVGLLTVAALRGRGTATVAGVDPVPARRALALTMGATDVFEPDDPALHGLDPALVVEASGHPSALPQAGNVARAGGTVLMLGVPMGSSEVWPMVWVTKELRFVGSIAQSASDFTAALDQLAGDPSFGRVITDRIGLDQVPDAFDRLTRAPDAGKVTATPTT
jgi:threonine dehydrogenase-like Zn-dependent dehydrogenase